MLGEPTLADKQEKAVDAKQKTVVDVRIGRHPGFERVVFETSGTGRSGWFAGLTTEPRQPGSGFPVPYEGASALQIAITGVVYPFDTDSPEFDGTVAGQGGLVTGISNQRTYEGQHQFTIGLTKAVPYSITWLEEPGRVVVDFKTS